jgi:hypothetical protein
MWELLVILALLAILAQEGLAMAAHGCMVMLQYLDSSIMLLHKTITTVLV